ncbi:Rv3235 family protein, partial [Clavibacter zhangzhiyongii]|uniref:Rv3235 family protein n=1 Tax=Clavibacter zhangzhiyongii TaxID=2768071 RepID=UPI001BB3A5B2
SAAAPGSAASSRASTPASPAATATATVRGTVRKRFDVDDFFGRQPCSSQDLPPSGPLLENLTRCVIEILAGARELDQIARWVSDDVYRHLLKRVVLSARARRTKGQSVTRPVFSIGTVTSFSPRDGVIEAVIVVHGRARARAVAIRLEGLDRRWRATAINVL